MIIWLLGHPGNVIVSCSFGCITWIYQWDCPSIPVFLIDKFYFRGCAIIVEFFPVSVLPFYSKLWILQDNQWKVTVKLAQMNIFLILILHTSEPLQVKEILLVIGSFGRWKLLTDFHFKGRWRATDNILWLCTVKESEQSCSWCFQFRDVVVYRL